MADPLANILAERGELTFNQAFANARARGETTFKWRDPKSGRLQTYTTARADDKPSLSNNAMLESTRARREASDLMNLPLMPADLPQKDRELWQHYTPEARARRINESDQTSDNMLMQRVASQQLNDELDRRQQDESSDRAKIQGVNRQLADEHLARMRDYELRNSIESQVNEAYYPEIFRLQDLNRQAQQQIADVSLRQLAQDEARYFAAEEAADRERQMNRLRAQAIQPVYPELFLTPLGRGINALRGLFVRPRAPAPVRIEPTL